LNAPKRIVTVDINNQNQKTGKTLLKQRMLSPSTGGGYFLQITKDAVSLVKQYDYSGKIDTKSNFQEWGTAGGFSGKKKRKPLFLVYKLHHTGFNF
jgi:prolyl oligopeptidase